MNTPNEMTLRDWFAGQALAGWAAGRNRDTQQTSGAPDYIARTSYGYADAMLAERERREKEAKPAPSTPTGGDDEAWARKKEAVIEPCEAGWYAYYLCEVGIELTHARGATIAKALRALRAKVEGGAR